MRYKGKYFLSLNGEVPNKRGKVIGSSKDIIKVIHYDWVFGDECNYGEYKKDELYNFKFCNTIRELATLCEKYVTKDREQRGLRSLMPLTIF